MDFRLIINEDNRTVPVGIVCKYFRGFWWFKLSAFIFTRALGKLFD